MADLQKEFWESERVFKRRHPSHPVIEAFAVPKIKQILDIMMLKGERLNTNDLTMLEAGAGNGYFSYYLSNFFELTCLDFSRNILSINPADNKIVASATHIPFKNRSFKIVFCANLLHHINDPLIVINEMIRVSSRYIVIIEPNRNNPLMLMLSALSKEERLVSKYTGKYLETLLQNRVKILWKGTSGFILPNKTPKLLLSLLKRVEPFLYPKFYNVVIAEK